MSDLRSRLIRLAHAKPELRPDLLPLLKQGAKQLPPFEKLTPAQREKATEYMKEDPFFKRTLPKSGPAATWNSYVRENSSEAEDAWAAIK